MSVNKVTIPSLQICKVARSAKKTGGGINTTLYFINTTLFPQRNPWNWMFMYNFRAEYHEHNKITSKKVKIAYWFLKHLVCRWFQLVSWANSFFFAYKFWWPMGTASNGWNDKLQQTCSLPFPKEKEEGEATYIFRPASPSFLKTWKKKSDLHSASTQ